MMPSEGCGKAHRECPRSPGGRVLQMRCALKIVQNRIRQAAHLFGWDASERRSLARRHLACFVRVLSCLLSPPELVLHSAITLHWRHPASAAMTRHAPGRCRRGLGSFARAAR